MTETGKIKSIHEDIVVIGCGDVAACKSCGGSAFCSVKERTFEALNRQNIELKIGDQVSVLLPPGQTIFAAFLVMILPLLLFVFFFVAAGRLFPGLHEGVKVLAGLLGLGGGFLTSFLYSRATRKTRVPEVLSKLSTEEEL